MLETYDRSSENWKKHTNDLSSGSTTKAATDTVRHPVRFHSNTFLFMLPRAAVSLRDGILGRFSAVLIFLVSCA
ncbi:hypothetical protein OESDEN_11007 [Oesophagostomum dentatum]|uniref:Uncharacterized protein n=1 Tax=Oesophagostomum dentatum TaxID=61180 RepID=A0A0B1T1B2_OESDE|nr:hypothetical protein OESDEN_11007 [Oesophagostomum dentatum]